MEDTHRNREEVWRISELLKIFKRQANKYEGFLNYGKYLKEKWGIVKDLYGGYLKENSRIMKDFPIMEDT